MRWQACVLRTQVVAGELRGGSYRLVLATEAKRRPREVGLGGPLGQ